MLCLLMQLPEFEPDDTQVEFEFSRSGTASAIRRSQYFQCIRLARLDPMPEADRHGQRLIVEPVLMQKLALPTQRHQKPQHPALDDRFKLGSSTGTVAKTTP